MFDHLAARMRRSDINFRLLIPLLFSAVAVQAVVAIVRVTTSYRVVELGLPVIWLGIISTAYAILPALIALWLGRFIDRGHDALATWIGAGLDGGRLRRPPGLRRVQGNAACRTAVLGIGNLFAIVSQQILCVRCSRMHSRESVFGNYMVACAVGQGLGPADRRLGGRRRDGAADPVAVRGRASCSPVGLASRCAIRPSRHRGAASAARS